MAGVTRRFNDTVAIEDLDLTIPSGSVVGVIGPSGSGKTTTIRMITGSLGPTSGEVEVLGESPSSFRRPTRERIGYMPQQFSLSPDLTVGENVDFAAAVYGLVLWRRWRRKREVLELVDLWSVRSRRAGQLSGGMKRRLELAAALVHEPDLLILDEPTAGIDPILRRTVWDEIHRLRDGGVTSIVTTQYVTEAEECNAVALISGGRLIAFGGPEDLRRDALGGDVVEVTMAGAYDSAAFARTEGVRGVRQTGAQTFELVVDDAATATAEAVQTMSTEAGQVQAVREIRPSFEDVFAHLVERDRMSRTPTPGESEQAAPSAARAAEAARQTEAARQAEASRAADVEREADAAQVARAAEATRDLDAARDGDAARAVPRPSAAETPGAPDDPAVPPTTGGPR